MFKIFFDSPKIFSMFVKKWKPKYIGYKEKIIDII